MIRVFPSCIKQLSHAASERKILKIEVMASNVNIYYKQKKEDEFYPFRSENMLVRR